MRVIDGVIRTIKFMMVINFANVIKSLVTLAVLVIFRHIYGLICVVWLRRKKIWSKNEI